MKKSKLMNVATNFLLLIFILGHGWPSYAFLPDKNFIFPEHLQFKQKIITNGKYVEKNSPFISSLISILAMQDNDQIGRCSGVLIAKDMVLTAGHCVSQKALENPVSYISIMTYLNQQMIIRKVLSAARHPNFAVSTNYILHDVALLKIETLDSNDFVPAELPGIALELGVLYPVQISGFGETKDGIKNVLAKYASANAKLISVRDDYHLELSGPSLICHGDSGGPVLSINPVTGAYTVIGINSYILLSSPCERYAYASSVREHLRWIMDTMTLLRSVRGI